MHHAAIFYEAEAYITSGQKLMGRQSAGEGFLRAAARSDAARLVCYANTPNSAQHFADELVRHGFKGKAEWVPTLAHAALADEGCLYLPGPNLADDAWRRGASGERAYSLCGMTYTISSHAAMSAITDLLVAPVRSWDALICISTVVRDAARYLLEKQAEYLRSRLGASRFELPQLPMIPLGVHCDDFVFSPEQRSAARQELGIDGGEIVILFAGRLSFHAKAHPQQMYTALERIAQGRRIRLIQSGKFFNDYIEKAFLEGASVLCPSVQVTNLDGRAGQNYRHAWAAADVFISLSDNIQESLGLTPIEAMAAGLPVIVSDWNGYKDTVRDGVDGFRIPTLMPPAPLGEELAMRYDIGADNFDIYSGHASQHVALDPAALENALARLVDDAALRKQMGESGRRRARQDYDWSTIYRRYQTLWEELAERRRADPDLYPRAGAISRPDRPDPFAVFAGFPSSLLSDDHLVAPLQADLGKMRKLAMNAFSRTTHPDDAEFGAILSMLAERAPRTVREIVAAFPAERRAVIMRSLVWLAKMEAVHITARDKQ